MAQQTRNFDSPLFREIHKNTWLKKVNVNDSKKVLNRTCISNIVIVMFQRKERLWVVFCVHDDSDAYLEAYADSKVAVLHRPDWVVSLNDTQHISPTICPHEQEYEFVITLHTEIVRLAAPTWDQMIDWVESLRVKLHELRILSPKENIYSKMPEAKSATLLSTRDPTSPLPPPPPVPPVILPGVEVTNSRNHPVLQRGISLPDSNSIIESSPLNHVTIVEVESASQPDVFNFENLTNSNTPSTTSSVHYERLYHLHSPGSHTKNIDMSLLF